MPRMTEVKRERARELRHDMTSAERVLWEHLRGHRADGLHFRRQHVIRGFIVDFYCHAARLVVEVDGAIHDQQRDADTERDTILIANGYRMLRVTNDEVLAQLDDVLERIHSLCSDAQLLLVPAPTEATRG
jgi:very-short-patch-repair endonuclease